MEGRVSSWAHPARSRSQPVTLPPRRWLRVASCRCAVSLRTERPEPPSLGAAGPVRGDSESEMPRPGRRLGSVQNGLPMKPMAWVQHGIRLHDGECLQQPCARTHGFCRSCCFIARSPKKGNEIQRCWRLCELSCCASNGPDLLIRHASIISYS